VVATTSDILIAFAKPVIRLNSSQFQFRFLPHNPGLDPSWPAFERRAMLCTSKEISQEVYL
jgi:hypothetical protein